MPDFPVLPPSPYPVGVFPQFYNHDQTVSLKLASKSLGYRIKYAVNKAPVFKVTGKVFSAHGRKEFEDVDGNSLFELKRESLSLAYVAKRAGSGSYIFTIQRKFWSVHDEMSVKFQNEASGREEELIVRGNWSRRSVTIQLGRDGPIVATITRKRWKMSTYYIHVAPGVDLALMSALCVCLDEVAKSRASAATGAAAASM